MRFSANPSPTPYAALNTVLASFVERVRDLTADNFVGAYLQGSFALGDFDENSDADFLIVVKRDIADSDVPALNALHAAIHDFPPPWGHRLEGSYSPAAIRRRTSRTFRIDNLSAGIRPPFANRKRRTLPGSDCRQRSPLHPINRVAGFVRNRWPHWLGFRTEAAEARVVSRPRPAPDGPGCPSWVLSLSPAWRWGNAEVCQTRGSYWSLDASFAGLPTLTKALEFVDN
jgi:hypothetical protein